MNRSLTIVLPVYNAESRLRRSIDEVLEMASELTPELSLLIVDDGSTDTTFEVAAELAARYPQVSLRRHRHRRGLGATLDYVQRRVRADVVMIHDGVSPIDPNQLHAVWRRWQAAGATDYRRPGRSSGTPDALEIDSLAALQSALERAHSRAAGFQLLCSQPAGAVKPEATPATSLQRSRTDVRLSRTDVGRIPPPPRPKLLSTLADFAWGE